MNVSSGKTVCPVNSFNEWDPLEEVVVGRLEESVFPPHELYVSSGVPRILHHLLRFVGGLKKRPLPIFITPAQRELNNFIHILEAEGVKIRRPEIMDHGLLFKTPWWQSRGHTSACPRDCFLVIGDEIIEAPMPWRNRYHERHAYYGLFKEYFDRGAKWTSPPKPPLRDELYANDYTVPGHGEKIRYILNETEVVFDAADFIRCGRDLFVIKSNCTNEAGISWLERHLGNGFRIHRIETAARQPVHIDTTIMPLAPGKLLVNPAYVDAAKLPAVLRSWDILTAPKPMADSSTKFLDRAILMCSPWVSMNVLMLDEKRVIVEKSQASMIGALKDWGFKPIPCRFLNYNQFGGGFHCATLDIRRRGKLQSYFP